MSKVGWFDGVETDGRTRPIAVTRSAVLSSGLCTEKASGEDVERMLRDACMLRGVRHNNVKSVVGVCVEPRGPPPLLLYRFDNDCNLKIYLQLCRTAHVYALSVLAAYSSFTPPHQTRQDCRARLSTAAAATQARQAATQPPARPPTRSDVVRHAKCKHAVDCCI